MQDPHAKRTESILDHVGLYRISLRAVLERRYFGGRSCGNVVQRPIDQKRLVSRKGLGRSLSFYQLTLPEARRRNLPQDRGRPLGPRALGTHLAILWFACMTDARRRRLEDAEVAQAFGDSPSGCPHVAESKPQKRFFRIHVVSPATRVPDMIKRLEAEIAAAHLHAQLDKWLSVQRYTFAFVNGSSSRRRDPRRHPGSGHEGPTAQPAARTLRGGPQSTNDSRGDS
jgi:hypothetical protein